MVQRIALLTARLTTAAWVGAAVLFVIAGVREIRLGQFDQATISRLVSARFPAFYATGALLLTVALVSTGVLATRRRLYRPIVALIGLSLALMAADYMVIYAKLAAMMSSDTRPPGFARLHDYSKWINSAGIVLAAAASFRLCWPERRE